MRPVDGKDPIEFGMDAPRPAMFCPMCGTSRWVTNNAEEIRTRHHAQQVQLANLRAQLALAAEGPQAQAIRVLALRVAELETELEAHRLGWWERKARRQTEQIIRLEKRNARLRAQIRGDAA